MDDMINSQPVEELPVHPYTRMRAIAVFPSGRVVWPVLGGSGEGEDDDSGEDDGGEEDAEEDDESGEGDDSGEKPTEKETKPKGDDKPVSRAELAKVIAARDKAKADARAKTRELEELKRKSETADETVRREAAEAAQAAADAKYKPISVRAGLLEAGVKPSRVKGALRLLDMAEIEIDEDGEVTGLDAQLTTLKADWPELFADAEAEEKKPEQRRPSRGADGADKKPPAKKELTATEKQAMQLLGKG